MEERFPMTPRGHQAMRDELYRLKTVERIAIARAIEEARGHGDLSENAEYHAAKERQGWIEARIRDLEAKLARAQVIDPSKLSGTRVVFGATVKVADAETGEEATYRIVGEDESDVKAGRISIASPLARAMVGKEAGDVVTVRTPKGPREYEVLEVRFGEA